MSCCHGQSFTEAPIRVAQDYSAIFYPLSFVFQVKHNADLRASGFHPKVSKPYCAYLPNSVSTCYVIMTLKSELKFK